MQYSATMLTTSTSLILLITAGLAFSNAFSRSAALAQQVDTAVSSYKPELVTPPNNAGYVLPDGSVRVEGPDEMGEIISRLNALFVQFHPGVKFTYVKANSVASIYSLIYDSTALAFSRQDYASSLTYTDIVHGEPFSIRAAHASLNPSSTFSPLAVIVNKSNPLDTISFKQLTCIFSQGTRTRVFTRWSQVGVAGDLAPLDIRPSGLPWSDHYPSEDTTFGDFFFLRKLGANEPVRTYKAFSTYAEVVKDVASNPAAIGVTTLNRVTPDVKVLAISRGDLKAPSVGTEADIHDGEYPLDRYLRIYCRVSSGKPFDPFVREYLRMVLSKEGQRVIGEDPHGYLPLNAFELHEDLASFQ